MHDGFAVETARHGQPGPNFPFTAEVEALTAPLWDRLKSKVSPLEWQVHAPLIAEMWTALKAGPLAGQALARCYANGMPGGVEGGLHLDSNIDSHLTAIYYPHPAWGPNFGGETLLFNAAGDEILAAIYPKPNRLAVFSGAIPHVARPMSRKRPELRITLMFKTMPIAGG